MIKLFLFFVFFIFILILWFFLFPVRRTKRVFLCEDLVEPPEKFIYSYVFHIHTQFSYDSLGKPQDVIEARDLLGIDFVVVTDHDDDSIKIFADERLLAGKEIKLNNKEGQLQGNLLQIGSINVIAHHFRNRYRWKLEKNKDFLFELINLRDVFLAHKRKLFFYSITAILLYPFMGKSLISSFIKLIDTKSYALKYLSEGWRCKIIGGLDHHVKFYVKEVKRRIMLPSYKISFSLMRNFLLSSIPIKGKEDFLKAMKEGVNVISFSDKPSFVWVEENKIKACSPFTNTYMIVISENLKEREFLGSNLLLSDLEPGYYIILGYTYKFRFGGMLFGVKPLFVSDLLEIEDDN